MSNTLEFALKINTTGIKQALEKVSDDASKIRPRLPVPTVPNIPNVPTLPKIPSQSDIAPSFTGNTGTIGGFTRDFSSRFKTFKEEFKTETNNLFSGIKNAKGLIEAKGAIAGFTGNLAGSLMKLGGIFGKVILAVGALSAATLKFSTVAEQATFRLQRSFRTGGRMAGQGTSDYTGRYSFVEDLAMQGKIDKGEYLGALGYARQNYQSLDKKTFDTMARTSVDLGAHMGISGGEALKQLGGVLDSLNVSFDTMKTLGISATRAEVDRINALKSAGKKAEENAIILKKVQDVTNGASAEYEKTVAGSLKKFWNLFKEMMANLGKAIAPAFKIIMALVNKVMEAFNLIAKTIGDLFDMLAQSIDKLFSIFGIKTRLSMQGEGNDTTDSRKQAEAGKYIDPRLQIQVSFEDSTSMVSRIQKSILEKNSPQVKQVELLKLVNDKMDKMLISSKNREKTAERQVEEATGLRKVTTATSYGLQGG